MRKYLITLALIALIVAASGCIGGGGEDEKSSPGPGVIITGFRSDFATVDADEPISVMLDFENRGDFEATNVKGDLIRRGAFIDIQGVHDGYDMTVNLERPLEDSFDGDEFIWDMTAPLISQGRTEEVQARLSYGYRTEGFATINFVPRDILREQGAGAFSLESSSTKGPIEAEIIANQPITIREGDEATHELGTAGTWTCKVSGGVYTWNNTSSGIGSPITEEVCHGGVLSTPHGVTCKASELGNTSTCQKRNVTYAEKDLRVTILLSNAWNGKAETTDATAIANCNTDSDCIKYVKLTTYGGDCQILEGTSKIPVSPSILYDQTGVRMIQGEEGRITVPIKFAIVNYDAATSCQLKVEADYTYRIDSDVLSINVRGTSELG